MDNQISFLCYQNHFSAIIEANRIPLECWCVDTAFHKCAISALSSDDFAVEIFYSGIFAEVTFFLLVAILPIFCYRNCTKQCMLNTFL